MNKFKHNKFKCGDFVKVHGDKLNRIYVVDSFMFDFFRNNNVYHILQYNGTDMGYYSEDMLCSSSLEETRYKYKVSAKPKKKNEKIDNMFKSVSILINGNIEIPLKDAQLDMESCKIYPEKYERDGKTIKRIKIPANICPTKVTLTGTIDPCMKIEM